jgi:two-component system CheB/CheR fusion protein
MAPTQPGDTGLTESESAAAEGATEPGAPAEPPREQFPIVGIGASAGGLEALRRLLPAMEAGCGMAFVVIMHLAPHQQSLMAEILERSCDLPVVQGEGGQLVSLEHVYVIPPNAVMTLADGRLVLVPASPHRGHPTVIDVFFASLAADRASECAGIVLSGSGSDGTLGLRAIKEAGGLTMAQAEAEYDSMTRSAVASGLVDVVLPAEQMVERLTMHFQYRHGAGRRLTEAPFGREGLAQINALLRQHTGHDFSEYKDRTIIRRVQRRMQVLQIDDLSTFTERLRRDPAEVGRLFQDLLIGVTSFFRDPEAFAVLEREVIPALFARRSPDDTIRVWVPGCATGEEAYSLAMMLRDNTPRGQGAPRLQIFASDIDEHALQIARAGRYPGAVAKDIAPTRIDRYFQKEDGTLRVAAELREICLFSSHNLLRDAPFSRLDLISCRNLLIYLDSELQNRVIPLFHYALNPNGYLFLGSSENVTKHSRLFATIDKNHRIFQRRAHIERQLPSFPLSSAEYGRRPTQLTSGQPPSVEQTLRSTTERTILDRFAPAHAVINAEGDLLMASGRTGKYLELPAGAPDTNVFSMARSGLRLDLRALVHRASSGGHAVSLQNVRVDTSSGRQTVDLHVQPLAYGTGNDPLYLIVFQDVGALHPHPDAGPEEIDPASSDRTRQLELELRATRERLQTVTEELESSNEELKSGNEELSSINEELQSSNEELETSKEELQSINEELQTVNGELSSRVEELSRANNDMANLLASTQIATVFLDHGLVVKGFTPAAKDIFRLVESDTGRPILHIRSLVDMDTLQDDAERVLRTLSTIERQVSNRLNDTRYVMRMLPYRTAENMISGVVMTFTDVTRVTAAEARIDELTQTLRARVRDLETLLDLLPVGVMILGGEGSGEVVINQYGARLIGAPDQGGGLQPVGQPPRLFEGTAEIPPAEHPLTRAARTGQPVELLDGRVVGADGRSTPVMIAAAPLREDAERVRGAVAALIDLSPHKHAKADQLVLMHELQHRVKNILATVAALSSRVARSSRSVDEFHAAFLPRLSAMGRIHDLLSGNHWHDADLRSLLLTALQSHAGEGHGNVVMTGEDIQLPPTMAPTLGMVFYELATNAAKYGAFSTSSGVVEVTWAVGGSTGDTPRSLRITWVERDGPAVGAPGPAGFGTSFIRRSIEYELDGGIEVDMASSGARWTMDMPLPDPPG